MDLPHGPDLTGRQERAGYESWIVDQLARVVRERDRLVEGSGRLHDSIRHQLDGGGKLVRPRLFIGFAALTEEEEPSDPAMRAAAAIEALHECSLMHDDVVDHASIRRGRASLASLSVRDAALAGIFMAGRAIESLALACRDSGVELDLGILRELTRAQIVEGLPMASSIEQQMARVRAVFKGKTGVLFTLAVKLGAAFGAAAGRAVPCPERLDRFCSCLCFAYQARDDILDLELSDALRRPGNGDIIEGKVTWPIVLWIDTQARKEHARQRLAAATGDEGAAESLRLEIVRSGVLEKARQEVDRQIGLALGILSEVPDGRGYRLIKDTLACLRFA